MTVLTMGAILIAVAAFGAGWFRGYKKACDAHGWNLPSIDWNNRLEQQSSPLISPKRPAVFTWIFEFLFAATR